MFGSQVLDMVIGLAFLYLFLSVICSAIQEWLAGIFSLRAKTLDEGIRNLLNDVDGTGLTAELYNHPLIKGLSRSTGSQDGSKLRSKPSYIPSRNFTLAILDSILPDKKNKLHTIEDLRIAIENIDNQPVKQVLTSMMSQVGEDLGALQNDIENWFDQAMTRAGGWYKRQSQKIIFLIAVLTTVVMNADSLMLCKALWQDKTLRVSVVSFVENKIVTEKLTDQQAESIMNTQLEKLALPIGWSTNPEHVTTIPRGFWVWIEKILGLMITCFAVSLGAPFWFDALSKLVNLRTSGLQPRKPT